VARALAHDPAILLADEPTAALDAETGAALIDDLRRAAADGRTLIAVSHDERLLALMDEVIELRAGRPLEAA
jgi:putative ABC transport system ATP-binding protein